MGDLGGSGEAFGCAREGVRGVSGALGVLVEVFGGAGGVRRDVSVGLGDLGVSGLFEGGRLG